MLISTTDLRRFSTRILHEAGAPAPIAETVAEHLVLSNASGHDSHGVVRIPQYLDQIERGHLDPAAEPVVLRAQAATLLVDAQRGFGQFTTAGALDWAIQTARQHGVCSASIRRSMHAGRLGHYAEKASAHGMLAIVMVGVAGRNRGWMPLHGSSGRFVGANPWAIGIPAKSGDFVFDASMTNVAQGKVQVARAKAEKMPIGWVLDRNGRPSTVPDALYDGGSLVALGGEIAGA